MFTFTTDLKKSSQGTMDYMTDLNSGVIITIWMDNNAVHSASTFIGVQPMSSRGEIQERNPVPKDHKGIQWWDGWH